MTLTIVENAAIYATTISTFGIERRQKETLLAVVKECFAVGCENCNDDKFQNKMSTHLREVIRRYDIRGASKPCVRGIATKAMQAGYDKYRKRE